MELLLAHHTRTNYNVIELADANPSVDVYLSEEGIEQAENLAELLKDIDYDVVYTSELPRARQTAEITNKCHNKDLIVGARINDNKTEDYKSLERLYQPSDYEGCYRYDRQMAV